jgi:hypothetical protein
MSFESEPSLHERECRRKKGFGTEADKDCMAHAFAICSRYESLS